jgi:hypothetical protein
LRAEFDDTVHEGERPEKVVRRRTRRKPESGGGGQEEVNLLGYSFRQIFDGSIDASALVHDLHLSLLVFFCSAAPADSIELKRCSECLHHSQTRRTWPVAWLP